MGMASKRICTISAAGTKVGRCEMLSEGRWARLDWGIVLFGNGREGKERDRFKPGPGAGADLD